MNPVATNPALLPIMRYLRDVLGVSESSIKPARDGYEPSDFQDGTIMVDAIGPDTVLNTTESFDNINEIMTYVTRLVVEVTVDFYGDTGYSNCYRLLALYSGQSSKTAQRAHGVTIYKPRSVVDLRLLAGSQFTGRVQMAFTAWVNITTTEDLKRIDTAILSSVITNN